MPTRKLRTLQRQTAAPRPERSGVIERLENPVEIVGDTCRPRRCPSAVRRFRLAVCQGTILLEQKRRLEVNDLTGDAADTSRSGPLEVAVILLIFREVVAASC